MQNPDHTSHASRALSNFTFDMANAGLIRHMAEAGYSVKQIKEATDYPVPIEKIAETVWDYYLEEGIILMDIDNIPNEKTEYVMDIGKYGKRSFRQIKSEVKTDHIDKNNYIPCDFGIWKRHDEKRYDAALACLDSRKRDYIDGLPWPDSRVYHVADVRMREISEMLSIPTVPESRISIER